MELIYDNFYEEANNILVSYFWDTIDILSMAIQEIKEHPSYSVIEQNKI